MWRFTLANIIFHKFLEFHSTVTANPQLQEPIITWWKKCCGLWLPWLQYISLQIIHICLLFFIFRKSWIISSVIFSGRLRKIHLLKTDNTRKSFIFIHVSNHCFPYIKFCFFSFCKTANFWMSIAQKPAGKSHTSPGKKFAEKKEVSHSSTTNLYFQSKCGHHKQKSHSSCNYRWVP